MLVTISPGLTASPSGIFSHAGIKPTTLSGKFKRPIVFITPKTVAAPHISYFISSIAAPGLREMPPESNVIPLPTNTTGFEDFLPLLCSMIMNFGSNLLPFATDKKEPIFNFSICFWLNIVDFILKSLAIFFAWFARYVGVQILGGKLPKSFVKFIPSAIA